MRLWAFDILQHLAAWSRQRSPTSDAWFHSSSALACGGMRPFKHKRLILIPELRERLMQAAEYKLETVRSLGMQRCQPLAVLQMLASSEPGTANRNWHRRLAVSVLSCTSVMRERLHCSLLRQRTEA
jgi:hypothetical protein